MKNVGENINCNKISLQFFNPLRKKNGYYYIYNRDEKKVGVLVLYDQNENSKSARLIHKGINIGYIIYFCGIKLSEICLFVNFVVDHICYFEI